MPTNTLTDNDCKKAAPAATAQKYFDGNGLYLWVSPAGAKVWRQAYRRPSDGKQDTIVHGRYPLISLKLAREKRDEALRALAAGQDPKLSAAPPAAPAGTNSITLQKASDTYWDGKKDISDGYRTNAKRGIELHLAKLLKSDIRAITREDMLECLNATDAAGHHEYVRKVRMWSSQVWHWAVEQKHADQNIPDTINPKRAFGKKKVKSFPSLHVDRDFPAFWQRMEMEGDLMSALAAEMLARTWVRTKEMRFMEWTEIDAFAGLFTSGRRSMTPDVDREWLWEIPEGKMKKTRPHLVPLPRQARALLLKLWARSRGSKYVFAAEHRLDRTISENTVLALISRLGYKGIMTGHGFRSVASTWANERGYNHDWIERQLAHVEDNKVRGAYNKAEYLTGRSKLLQEFSDWLDTLRSNKAANSERALLAA